MPESPVRTQKRLRLIACEIAFRELCYLASQSVNIVDLEFMPKGLHDIPKDRMQARLQERIDAVPADQYEAILLGYGRCNDGIVGLTARTRPLVVPRAHDCITFFMGDRHRYRRYFDENPGTFYRTTGWSERDFVRDREKQEGVMTRLGLGRSYEEYVAQYGEENAKFILAMTSGWMENYKRIAYIDMGVAEHLGHAEAARQQALERGWTFDHLAGNLDLLRRLLDGPWDPADFLIVQPGSRIVARNDHYVLGADATAPAGAPQGPATTAS